MSATYSNSVLQEAMQRALEQAQPPPRDTRESASAKAPPPRPQLTAADLKALARLSIPGLAEAAQAVRDARDVVADVERRIDEREFAARDAARRRGALERRERTEDVDLGEEIAAADQEAQAALGLAKRLREGLPEAQAEVAAAEAAVARVLRKEALRLAPAYKERGQVKLRESQDAHREFGTLDAAAAKLDKAGKDQRSTVADLAGLLAEAAQDGIGRS
jgi:hypothetical protein